MTKELTAKRANELVLQNFDDGIARLEKMDTSESILFNSRSKLGLNVDDPDKPIACGIAYATRFTWKDRQRPMHPALRRRYQDGQASPFTLYGTKLARDIVLEDLRTARETIAKEV